MKLPRYHQDRSSGKKYRQQKWRKKQKWKTNKTNNRPTSSRSPVGIKNFLLPKQSEWATVWALNWLVDWGIFTYFHQAEPGKEHEPGEVDGKIGADFIPFLPSGDAKPFQLKSTRKRRFTKIRNRHLKKHAHVRYIVILCPNDIPESENDKRKIIGVAKIIFEILFPGNSFNNFFDL